jgi:hypothetical protein
MNLNYPTFFVIVALSAALPLLPFLIPSRGDNKNSLKCIPLEIVRSHANTVGITALNGQFFVNERLTSATLNTTDKCVQGLPPKTINDLKQAQAQQQRQ